MTQKLLFFTLLLVFTSSKTIDAQIIELKSGTFNLLQQSTSERNETNTLAVFDKQFYGLMYAKEKEKIKSEHIISWLSKEVVLTQIPLELAIQSEHNLYNLPAQWKIAPAVLDSLCTNCDLKLRINLYQYNDKIAHALKQFGVIDAYDGLNQSIHIQINSDSLFALMRNPFVFWAEFPAPKLEMNNLRERTNHRVSLISNFSPSHQLTGKGVVMGEWDGGGADDHIDYQFRHTRVDPFINNGNGRHATHVAGTMLGAGIKDPSAKGMAPEATFYSYDFFGNVPAEMDSACRKYGIEFTQNSYSYGSGFDVCNRRGSYDNTSVALDRVVNKYPNVLHVFSAGNSRGSNCLAGGYGTVHSGFQSSKNSISVGAVRYTDVNSWFSSYGPLKDGRLKPEITAVGVDVYSTFPNHAYRGGYNGTSMSCPGTSGTAALITQLYKEKFDTLPDAHLIKGVLCNAADDLGRAGPDFQYGFGRLNSFVAANIINDSNFVVDTVNQMGTFSDTLFIDNPHLFKVMLCYTDLEATSAASTALVNDLDLYLIDDAGDTLFPWVLNPSSPTTTAVRGTDHLNNIEQVTIETPTSDYFVYTVRGSNVVSGNQIFSVNWLEQDTSLTIAYPNGGEKWLPPSNGATQQTIRWEAHGITGTGTLSYSIDSGSSWNTISSSVNLNLGYYNWQNCPSTVITSTALIKIEQGNYVDSSNAVFDIFQTGPAANAVPCSEQLHITWNSIANATGYYVYMNDSGAMKNMGYTTDEFFTLKGLADTLSYWVAIAPVAANGAEGPRGVAREFTPNPLVQTPTFTLNPRDSSVCSGSGVSFESTVIGTGSITKAWQVSIDQGETWNVIVGGNNDILALSSVYAQDDSSQYRFTAVNSCLSLETSPWAMLQVDSILPFTYVDTLINMCIGQDSIFELIQEGNNRNLVDWYFRATPSSSPQLLDKDTFTFWNIKDVQIANRGDYYGILKNSCGTQQIPTTISLEVNDPLQLTFQGEDTLCFGQTGQNLAVASGGRSANYDYFWQLDTLVISTAHLTRAHDSTETWQAGVYDFCSADTIYNTKTIAVRSLPQIELPDDTTICKGTSLPIVAKGSGGDITSYHYLWSHNLPDSAAVEVSPAVTTTYTVIFTDSCSTPIDSTSITISVLDALEVEISSTKDTLCTHEQHVLAVQGTGGDTGNYRFTWDDGTTSLNRTVSTDSDSTFYVQFTDNCTVLSANDSFSITVRPPLHVSISGKDTLCTNEKQTLTVSTMGGDAKNYTFIWDNGSTLTSRIISTQTDSIFYVQLTDNCTLKAAQDSFKTAVRPPLSISIVGADTLCLGEEVTYTATPLGGLPSAYTFNWGNSSSNSISLTGNLDTLIQVALSDGCTPQDATGQKQIIVRKALVLDPNKDLRICKNKQETITLQASGGKSADYQFFVNGQPSTPSFTRVYTDSTRLNFRLSDNCSATDAFDSMWVDIRPIFPVIFDIEQENLIVKAKTRNDGKENWWGRSSADLSPFNDSVASISYFNYGPAQLCLQKVDDAGCSETFCEDLVLFDVFKTDNINVSIYPNPADNEVNISLDKVAGVVKVNLITTDGKYIWRRNFSTFDQTLFTFDVSQLASSFYILEIVVNNQIIHEKISVK